jgi:7-carboxy-7-deazaguanine synthase
LPILRVMSMAETSRRYSVKEIFYTLQGEGAQSGRAAVFCRFAGCNLWTGREADRASAICQFCDTEFVGTDGVNGGVFPTAESLADALLSVWGGIDGVGSHAFVVLTGGEPLLQVDAALVSAIHRCGMEIAVETNGTLSVPEGVDWICVSPKAGATLRQVTGHELKVVVPQEGLDLHALGRLAFDHFYVQPMAGPDYEKNCNWAVEFCLAHPRWRVSTQMHKHLAIA